VRKELEDQGILDNSEQKEQADDEILAELKRCQAELKVSFCIPCQIPSSMSQGHHCFFIMKGGGTA
jgi:hypothetical protein